MAKINDVHSIIVPAEAADLSVHAYYEIYGGTDGCTVTVNGTLVNIGSSSNISIKVSSISGGTGCYLLGEKRDVFTGGDDYL